MSYVEAENMTGIFDIFEYADSVSDGFFSLGLIISLYVVIFLYLKGRGEETADSAAVSGFITSIAAVFLFLTGLVSGQHLFMVFMIFILSLLWTFFNKSA